VFLRVDSFILLVWVVELIFGVEWYHLLLVRVGFRFVFVMLVSRRFFILRLGLCLEVMLRSRFYF
jgi:hypothetical protein